MKLSAALEFEKLREDAASWNKVILHRDGKFYHAYDWSAWLIKQYVCTEEFQQQRGDEKLLQVNRYPSKHGEYAMLGFPLDSISKYIPAYEEARKMEDSDDMEITVSIDFGEADYETLQQMYEEWFANCQLKEKKGKSNAAMMHSDGNVMEQMEGMWNVSKESMYHSVNSWLGVLCHYDSFNIRCELFMNTRFLRYGSFDRDMTTFTLSKPTTDIAA